MVVVLGNVLVGMQALPRGQEPHRCPDLLLSGDERRDLGSNARAAAGEADDKARAAFVVLLGVRFPVVWRGAALGTATRRRDRGHGARGSWK